MNSVGERIAAKTRPIESGCHLWIGSKNPNGYGRLAIRDREAKRSRSRLVHRLVYEAVFGPIPNGLELDHLCRVRACVNPEHLEPVTHAENMRRSPFQGEWGRRRTHCPSGHAYDEANTRLYQGRRFCRKCHVLCSMRQKRERRARAASEVTA